MSGESFPVSAVIFFSHLAVFVGVVSKISVVAGVYIKLEIRH